ncbi:MAG: alpha/beta hydrolase-fold protein [Salibacteraceae bacterium]
MKKFIYLIAILSLLQNTCFGQNQESNNTNTNQISIGVRDQIYSKILGEERSIWVHVPESSIYGLEYPVIFLLDGEFHFESVVGIMRSNAISRLIPEMIIVAIPNTDRYRDLSTSHFGDDSNTSGGADNFTKFIESELIPYIDNNYPTISHRTLIGHSLGGLVVANAFVKYPHLFNNYLAIDPSLGWDNQKLLNEGRQQIKNGNYKSKAIYVAIANTINNGQVADMSFEKALQDTTTATLHLRSIHEFAELTKNNEQLVSEWKYYPDETHKTVPIVAEHHALKFLFSWYEFKDWDKFYTPEPKLTGEQLVELIVSHFNNISEKLGHTYLPEEYEINRLAYMYLGQNDFERASPFFELNINYFPERANAYDSMGDYYNSVSDTANAIKYFSMSLELGGVNGTEEKLEKLKPQK